MSIETVRITKQGRDQLSKLKSRTGIAQWNVLCRWALCLSLAEEGRPRAPKAGERPIEIAWKTFGGDYADVYLGLIRQRCVRWDACAANKHYWRATRAFAPGHPDPFR